MMMLFMLLFMIPLCFLNLYWLLQLMFFILMFIFILKFSFNNMYMYISYFMGLDLMSYMMILLTIWISSLMMMSSEKLYKLNMNSKLFMLVMISLLMMLYLSFSSLNLFMFYIFFEVSMIPLLMLLIGWGYQPERIDAGIYLLFYTLFVSLPMMLSMFYLYNKIFSLDFYFFQFFFIDSIYMYMFMNMIFLVKFPMFMVHLWLPKAHVEAPVSGSMILAGLMLKLGGYGMMRIYMMFFEIIMKFNMVFMIISLIGGIMVSLICIRQSDLKALIAYSSVAHMGLVLSGILSLKMIGMLGSLMMMLAHGLCSSGLFVLANIMYERLMSRSMFMNKGLMNLMPSLSLWWFMFCICNMAAPPSLNLLSEILLINSLVSFSLFFMIFLSLLSFFSAVYSLLLFSFTQHGKYKKNYSYYMIFNREYMILFLHWLPLNILLLKMDMFFIWF